MRVIVSEDRTAAYVSAANAYAAGIDMDKALERMIVGEPELWPLSAPVVLVLGVEELLGDDVVVGHTVCLTGNEVMHTIASLGEYERPVSLSVVPVVDYHQRNNPSSGRAVAA